MHVQKKIPRDILPALTVGCVTKVFSFAFNACVNTNAMFCSRVTQNTANSRESPPLASIKPTQDSESDIDIPKKRDRKLWKSHNKGDFGTQSVNRGPISFYRLEKCNFLYLVSSIMYQFERKWCQIKAKELHLLKKKLIMAFIFSGFFSKKSFKIIIKFVK
ncbi:hypothetical protein BpHYR1_044005 [Brachionus plicatilis]|uniref:Uncharacterized protein n=1 Tax=Brachionus plicatilis TaxID=10195 RepID=A0A3M7PTT6_BRAPC|nr:hypothetical protein BpHYR1_044005 [Brachionus plicatilis]